MAGQGTYKVKKGDKFDKVAKDWGFIKPKQVWDDPMNRSLVTKRKKPEALEVGDVIRMPYTDKQKLDITNKKLFYLDLVDGERVLCETMLKRADLFIAAAKRAETQVKNSIAMRAELEKSLLKVEKDVKDTKFVVDTVNEVLTVLVSLAKVSAKAAKASGEELAKLNKEALKVITGIPADKAKGAAKSAGVDYLLDQKNEISVIGLTVGTLSESFDKMTSPGFWAQTIARMRTSGKGVTWESWADASTFDLKQEITNKLNIADRHFIPATKAATRDAQAAVKAAEGCQNLAKAALERVKIHTKNKDALPSW